MRSSSVSSSSSVHSMPKVSKKSGSQPKRKAPQSESDCEESEVEPDVLDSSSNSDESEDEAKEVESGKTTEEERVLSHAERRRQKRAEKLAAKRGAEDDADGSVKKKRKLKDGTAKDVSNPGEKSARKNSVWVGNLSFKTTHENLRTFFKDVGEITRIHLPTKAASKPNLQPENRGFAYVDFATSDAQQVAIALSEQPLLGRKLLIKLGDNFEGRPALPDLSLKDPQLVQKTHSKSAQKILRAQKQPAAPTLFFGNLGFATTQESLREMLEAHRPGKKEKKPEEEEGNDKEKGNVIWIRKIRLGTFEDTGKCKGFAFVDFASVEHATSCLINPKNHHLDGRQLVVEYAGADAVRRGASKSQLKDMPGGNDRPFKRPVRNSLHSPRKEWKTEGTTSDPSSGLATESVADAEEYTPDPKPSWSKPVPNEQNKDDRFRSYKLKSRPKPGAALALAKRESAAIVPSQGRKITF